MGMPMMSNYDVLSTLAYDGDRFKTQAIQEALSQFNLFAFVVHDPETHPEFDQFLEQNFDRLDHLTGSNLLFFALVKPSKDWLSHVRDRNYYIELNNPRNVPISNNCSDTAFCLAKTLNIPTEDLPCIVLSQGFELNKVKWIKTSISQLITQLTELGYKAARSRGKLSIESLELTFKYESGTLSDSLVRTLTDVMSFVLYKDNPQASRRGNKTIGELSAQIKTLKQQLHESASEASEELDTLCALIVSHLAQIPIIESATEPGEHVSGLVSEGKREFFEHDSFMLIRTAEKVFNLLRGGQLQEGIPNPAVQNGEYFDYTPEVICIGKAFENEMNLSVVHWVREKLGISLPKFFNLPQPDFRAVITPTSIPDRNEVNFNIDRGGKWWAPGIGESELVCIELGKSGIPSELDKTSWDILFEMWPIIRRKRNKAAHPGEVVNIESMRAIMSALEKLISKNIFDKSYLLKKEYRGLV